MIKIAYLCRKSIFSDPGGDTVQLKQTLKELELNNKFYGEVFTSPNALLCKLNDFNGVHIFGILDICEFIQILQPIKRSGKKIFISTIYVDYYQFERNSRVGAAKILSSLLDKYQIEYAKNAVKFLLRKRSASLKYFLYGHRRSIRMALSMADAVLPNSTSELRRVEVDFVKPNKAFVVVNGVDHGIFKFRTPESIKKSIDFLDGKFPENKFLNAVLCVGRIEGRKSQLDLIRALKDTSYNLYIIGKPASNQAEYYKNCVESAGVNTKFLDFVPHEVLVHIFTVARVHVLPSWFETTGLVSLEAAACGCNLVVSSLGDTQDYFKNYANYCTPDNVISILEAVDKAYKADPTEFSAYVASNYTWKLAAEQTFNCYLSVLLDEVF